MNFLIIGLGSAGQRHARVIRENFRFAKIDFFRGNHFMGLISPDLSTLNNSVDPRDAYNLREIKSLNHLKINYNLIVIATPPDSHMYYLDKIFLNSKKILIEKPISNRSQNFDKFRNAILRSTSEILIGYQHFYNPIFKYIFRQIGGEESIESLYIKYTEPLSKMNPFRNMDTHHLNYKSGGGALFSLSHEIDFCLRLCSGLYNNLTGQFTTRDHDFEVNRSCVITSKLTEEGKPKVHIFLSYKEFEAIERIGFLSTRNSFFAWDLNKKMVVSEIEGRRFFKIFEYSSDDLIKEQLFALLAGIDKDELLDRFDRASYITRIPIKLN